MRLIALRAAVGCTLGIVVVIRMVQRLRNDVVLERDVGRSATHRAARAGVGGLVDGPTDCAVIDDGVAGITQADTVHGLLAGLSQSETDETHNHVTATAHSGPPTAQANAITGGGLPRDREIAVGVVDGAGTFESDQPGDTKDDCAWPAGFNCRAITAGNHRLANC